MMKRGGEHTRGEGVRLQVKALEDKRRRAPAGRGPLCASHTVGPFRVAPSVLVLPVRCSAQMGTGSHALGFACRRAHFRLH